MALEHKRVVLGLLGGASLGSVLTAIGYAAEDVFARGSMSGPGAVFTAALMVSFFFWTAGLIVIGAPAWFVLRRLQWERPVHAAALGLVLPIIPAGFLFSDQTPATNILLAGAVAAVGALVGLVVRHIAYGVRHAAGTEAG